MPNAYNVIYDGIIEQIDRYIRIIADAALARAPSVGGGNA